MQRTQGTRISAALDALQQELQSLVNSSPSMLSQTSEERQQQIRLQAEERLGQMLAILGSTTSRASTPEDPHMEHPVVRRTSPMQIEHTQRNHDRTQPGANVVDMSEDPRWLSILAGAAQGGSIGAEEFGKGLFRAGTERRATIQTTEDDALTRLIRGYNDSQLNWISWADNIKQSYAAPDSDDNDPDLFAKQFRDIIYQVTELLMAGHTHTVQTFVHHVISFIKQCQLLDAIDDWIRDRAEAEEVVVSRADFISEAFNQRYASEIQRAHSGAGEAQAQLKKKLVSLRRSFQKRFEQHLQHALFLQDLYQYFGAAMLMDSFWAVNWTGDASPSTKTFRDLVTFACQNASPSADTLRHSQFALIHTISATGDQDSHNVVEGWFNMYQQQ
ncbi:hypothetical protein BDZ89DRAFT_1136615 [Hymenopellis radicata]|nr:hypothetical protein BDZ89DRAFT_1136615 [Hymenopellis radicata]